MTIRTFILTQDALSTVAKPLVESLKPGMTVALWGDLGAGKTTFTRCLLQELMGKDIDVPSPTFTLVQIYDTPKGEIWHCDLYRLKDSEEIFELGLEDAFHQAICVIEWPQRLGGLLPSHRIDVTLEIVDEITRKITIKEHPNNHDFFGKLLP